MSWEEVDKALDECLDALVACAKASLEAKKLTDIAQIYNEEARHWADKEKQLLFQERRCNS